MGSYMKHMPSHTKYNTFQQEIFVVSDLEYILLECYINVNVKTCVCVV